MTEPIEDIRHRLLAELPSDAARKALVMEWRCHGLIDDAAVAFWFYVFGLHAA